MPPKPLIPQKHAMPGFVRSALTKHDLMDAFRARREVIVEGLNMVTKHVKPRRQGEQGGIVKAEGAIYACKVMPVCPKCGKATRVGHSVKDGKTVRVCRKCGAEL